MVSVFVGCGDAPAPLPTQTHDNAGNGNNSSGNRQAQSITIDLSKLPTHVTTQSITLEPTISLQSGGNADVGEWTLLSGSAQKVLFTNADARDGTITLTVPLNGEYRLQISAEVGSQVRRLEHTLRFDVANPYQLNRSIIDDNNAAIGATAGLRWRPLGGVDDENQTYLMTTSQTGTFEAHGLLGAISDFDVAIHGD